MLAALLFPPHVIELAVSRSEFRFTAGRRECRFQPVIHFSTDRRVSAIGTPLQSDIGAGISLFEAGNDDAFDLLEALLRYGMQSVVSGGNIFRQRHLRIAISSDIRSQLAGFAEPIFKHVALRSGATEATIIQ